MFWIRISEKCQKQTNKLAYLRLQSIHQRPILLENGQIEIIMIIRNYNFAQMIYSDTNWIIRYSFATNLPQIVSYQIQLIN